MTLSPKAPVPIAIAPSIDALIMRRNQLDDELDKIRQQLRDAIRAATHDMPSPAEAKVLKLVRLKMSNKEIAGNLNISVFTVKFHIGNLLRKSACHNRWELWK